MIHIGETYFVKFVLDDMCQRIFYQGILTIWACMGERSPTTNQTLNQTFATNQTFVNQTFATNQIFDNQTFVNQTWPKQTWPNQTFVPNTTNNQTSMTNRTVNFTLGTKFKEWTRLSNDSVNTNRTNVQANRTRLSRNSVDVVHARYYIQIIWGVIVGLVFTCFVRYRYCRKSGNILPLTRSRRAPRSRSWTRERSFEPIVVRPRSASVP